MDETLTFGEKNIVDIFSRQVELMATSNGFEQPVAIKKQVKDL